MFIGEGIVTGEDVINANKEIFSSEEKMKNFKYGFIDYSNAFHFDASGDDAKIIADQDMEASKFIPDAILAILAREDLVFGLNRMWEMIAENAGLQWETMVFRDREKAEAWTKDRIRDKFSIDITMA